MSRDKDFRKIAKILSSFLRLSSSKIILAEGDSLKLLKLLPDNSISLILTDPPYHITKKGNIYGDKSFKRDEHYLEWMSGYATEWRRVLKPNGSLFCFCASPMLARLEVAFSKDFNILSQIVWTKPNDPGFDGWKQKMKKASLRQWYAHSERIIFAEPAYDGNMHRSYFGNLLRELRVKARLTAYELTAVTGAYGKINHGGAVSNWETGRNIPSREQYEKLSKAFIKTGKVEVLPPYEDVIRPFTVDSSKQFTDVWDFPSVRPFQGKHPAEKPVEMLEHAIKATTYPGDIVLDCFAGSGSTGSAAIKSGRSTVLMDIDPSWVSRIATRLELENISNGLEDSQANYSAERIKILPQPTLFS